jgi:hypothetical protein
LNYSEFDGPAAMGVEKKRHIDAVRLFSEICGTRDAARSIVALQEIALNYSSSTQTTV